VVLCKSISGVKDNVNAEPTSKRQAAIYHMGQTIVAAEFSTLSAQFHKYIAQAFASPYRKSSPDGLTNPGEFSIDNLSIPSLSQAAVSWTSSSSLRGGKRERLRLVLPPFVLLGEEDCNASHARQLVPLGALQMLTR
jgi:hypothetical protein